MRIDDAALVAAAELTDRYVTDRFLPDKAIDADRPGRARARIAARGPRPRARSARGRGRAAAPPSRAGRSSDRLEQLRRARDVAVDAEDYERAHCC